MHTPGPWSTGNIETRAILNSYGSVMYRGHPNQFTEADARLIAAAPEMLAALKLVAAQINTIDNIANPEACKAVREAIAKAENV